MFRILLHIYINITILRRTSRWNLGT